MGTTIRRQPITSSIPASPDYKFLNITNFGGIEKSSNPFVVSSNTSSDCLNVYVDEDNALTTRPRLEQIINYTHKEGTKADLATFTSLGYLVRHKGNEWVLSGQTIEETGSDKLPEGECVVFEKEGLPYVLGDSCYKKIEQKLDYWHGHKVVSEDISAYIPTVKVGKRQGYDVGTDYEELNILSDFYKETYYWDDTAASVPQKNSNADTIKNVGYFKLKIPYNDLQTSWAYNLADLKILKMFDDHFVAMSTVFGSEDDGGYLFVGHFKDNILTGLDWFHKEPAVSVPENVIHCSVSNNDYVFVEEANELSVYKYSKIDKNYIKINVSYDSDTPTIPSFCLRLHISNDASMLCVVYTYSTVDRTASHDILCYRLSYGQNTVHLAKLFQMPGQSASLGTLQSVYTTINRYDVADKGYYFLFINVCKVVNSNDYALFASTISEVPYYPSVTMNNLYTLKNKQALSLTYDYKTQTLACVASESSYKKSGVIWQFDVRDNGSTTENPYQINLKTQLPAIEDSIQDIIRLKMINDTTISIVSKNEVYVTDDLVGFTGTTPLALGFTNINDYEHNKYIKIDSLDSTHPDYDKDANGYLYIYALDDSEPPYEVTRSLKTSSYDVDKINKLRTIFKNSVITTTFNGERWFASENMLFHTRYGDVTYVPLTSYTELGESTKKITGLCIVNDNVMAIYKARKIYTTSPVSVDGEEQYVYVESKNTDGNDVVNTPIVTTLTEMPIIVSYNGIFALNQLENVQSSDRITTLISESINPLWLKERKTDINSCKTLNFLYWTYFILPHKKTKDEQSDYTKIYLLDNRTQQWYYWEIPILVINAFAENDYVTADKDYVFLIDDNADMYSLTSSDLQNEYNPDVTEYYDKIKGKKHIIPWHWYSQILSLNTINYSKKLVDTTFILTDTDTQDEYALDYSFKAWRKSVSETNATTINNNIHYVKSTTKRTMIPRFNFIQFRLNNTEDDLDNNKLRLVGLGLKYVLLEGLY